MHDDEAVSRFRVLTLSAKHRGHSGGKKRKQEIDIDDNRGGEASKDRDVGGAEQFAGRTSSPPAAAAAAPTVRKRFPETWIWTDAEVGYARGRFWGLDGWVHLLPLLRTCYVGI